MKKLKYIPITTMLMALTLFSCGESKTEDGHDEATHSETEENHSEGEDEEDNMVSFNSVFVQSDKRAN